MPRKIEKIIEGFFNDRGVNSLNGCDANRNASGGDVGAFCRCRYSSSISDADPLWEPYGRVVGGPDLIARWPFMATTVGPCGFNYIATVRDDGRRLRGLPIHRALASCLLSGFVWVSRAVSARVHGPSVISESN